MKLVLFFVLSFASLSVCELDISSIYEGMSKAIAASGAKESRKLLEQHFFTTNKTESIWPLAFEDTWKYLNRKFDKGDYITMEKDIKRLGNFWVSCTGGSTNDREDCPKEIFELMHTSMKDFQWTSNFPEFSRRNYVSIRVAYQAMELLMLKSLAEEPLVETMKEIADWYVTIKDEHLESLKYFVDFEEKMDDERPYDISTVEVCQVKQVLWKDFEQPACEKRWRKNLDDDEKGKRKRRDTVTAEENDEEESGEELENDEEDNKVESDDKSDYEFYETFGNPDFKKVERIGGVSGDFEMIMDGKFTDHGGSKVISFGRKISNLYKRPKGEVVEELVNVGFKKRDAYVKKVREGFNGYVNQTYGKVKKAAEVFAGQLKEHLIKSRKNTI